MPSLDYMQNSIHDWIMKAPGQYFSPEGMVDKMKKEAEELFEATQILANNETKISCAESAYSAWMKYKKEWKDAIADILLKNIPLDNIPQRQAEHQKTLAKLNHDVELELGDVLFAVWCLSNVYDVSLQASYEKFVTEDQEKLKTKIEKYIEKHIHTPSLSHLRNEWRSSYDYNERDYWPQKVLFYRLTNTIKHIEKIVLTGGILSNDYKRDWVIVAPSTKKALDAPLGIITNNLIDIAHRYGFTAESAFTAVMEKNNKRAANNYQKEVL